MQGGGLFCKVRGDLKGRLRTTHNKEAREASTMNQVGRGVLPSVTLQRDAVPRPTCAPWWGHATISSHW